MYDKNDPGIININSLTEIKELTDVYTQCIHCGMCLSSCPTYLLTGRETSSPRGRIRLIKSVAEGALAVTDTFAYEMNFCLDCQACETACPAGVKYGRMVEAARVEVDKQGYSSPVQHFFLKKIIPYRIRLRFAAKLLRLYQRSGLEKMLRSTIILSKLFPRIAEIEQFSPEIPAKFSDSYIREYNPPFSPTPAASDSTSGGISSTPIPSTDSGSSAGSYPSTEVKYRLAFSIGCLMDILLPEVNKDTVELLNKLGAMVISPSEQTCCGSLNAHNGDMKTARELAKKNIKTFARHEYDYLISNSAGCGAFMKEYGELLKDDPEFAESAREFSSKVKDVAEFLWTIDLPPLKNIETGNVTYHDACHLVHTQKIFNEPRDILKQVQGITVIPLEDSTKCCGSAGIYNLLHTDTSLKLLEEKMKNIGNTKAEVVLTGNPGCMLQIRYGVKKFNINVRAEHPATYLNRLI